MKRLGAAIRTDVRLQLRNGFYHAAAFIAVFSILGLRYLPAQMREFVLPALVVSNLLIGTFYFIAGLVLLEKAERTLEAIAVTPLRGHEYLAAKVITLGVLSLIENSAIVVLSHGFRIHILPLILGILMGAAVYTLFGFAVVARYSSINEFLLPSIVWATPLFVPFLHYFGLWGGGFWELFFALQPLQPSLILMRAAFVPVSAIELALAIAAGALWILIFWVWTRRGYARFAVRQEVAP